MKLQLVHTENYLVAVDDSEIKEVPCCNLAHRLVVKPTDLKWANSNRKNLKVITHHLPLNNAPVLEGMGLLPPLKDEVEELALKMGEERFAQRLYADYFKEGYNKAKEVYKYTEEDMEKAIVKAWLMAQEEETVYSAKEKIIQSLSQPKLPTSFDTETKQYIY
jgi:hypothetical protein